MSAEKMMVPHSCSNWRSHASIAAVAEIGGDVGGRGGSGGGGSGWVEGAVAVAAAGAGGAGVDESPLFSLLLRLLAFCGACLKP